MIKSRFIDSGWRLTIPKAIRDRLGWAPGTPICVSYDGIDIIVKCPTTCTDCPDVVRMGSLGKVVLPPRVRAEANLYRGQVMTLSVEDGRVLVKSGDSQVRCKACGRKWMSRGTGQRPSLSQCRVSAEGGSKTNLEVIDETSGHQDVRQHMSTLTNGWRFTPTAIQAHGWGAGTKPLP